MLLELVVGGMDKGNSTNGNVFDCSKTLFKGLKLRLRLDKRSIKTSHLRKPKFHFCEENLTTFLFTHEKVTIWWKNYPLVEKVTLWW